MACERVLVDYAELYQFFCFYIGLKSFKFAERRHTRCANSPDLTLGFIHPHLCWNIRFFGRVLDPWNGCRFSRFVKHLLSSSLGCQECLRTHVTSS